MASEYTYDEEGETWPFFVLAILTFVLVPLTWRWVSRVLSASSGAPNKLIVGALSDDHASVGVENAANIARYNRKQKLARVFNKTLVALLVGWAVVVYVAIYCTKEADLLSAFDPYAILEVAVSLSEREIKTKYRKLSLKFHPDKLPKDITETAKEQMEAAFIRINLAYKALTDEVTKRNFQLYGHPDGPQNVSHGIAIPKLFVEGKYSPVMLVVYFLLIGVLLPLLVGSWWSNVKLHTKKGLHVDTAALFVRRLADRNPGLVLTPYDLLDWICLSHEIKTEFPHLNVNEVKDLIAKHLFRNFDYQTLKPALEDDKVKVVALLPDLVTGLVDIATVFRNPDVILTALDLQKALVQAVKPIGRYQELLQLPYVNPEVVEKQPIHKLGKLVTLTEQEAGKALGITDPAKIKKALEVAAHIPQIRILDALFKVPGEEKVTPMANCHLSLKFLVKTPKLKSCPSVDADRLKDSESLDYLRNPLKINEEQPRLPLTYAPYFPGKITNNWIGVVIAQKDNKLVENSEAYRMTNVDLSNVELTQEKWIAGGDNVVVSTYKVPITAPTPPNIGTYHFRLVMKNNGYFGSDVDIPLEMKVESPPLNPELFKKKEATEDDEDSDSDISDPEEDSIAGALAALRGGAVKKVEEVDDDDVSDNESVFTDINTDTEDEGDS